MDKKKKITIAGILTFILLMAVTPLAAQRLSKVVFCGNDYDYELGCDSITLYLKLLDDDGEKVSLSLDRLSDQLVISEDGKDIIPERGEFRSQQGIPEDYTFTVLMDLGIPREGKEQVWQVVKKLVEDAPDSCVYVSFFGDEVTGSQLARGNRLDELHDLFMQEAQHKKFFSALYSKLKEIAGDGHSRGTAQAIARRARANEDKNVMFIFTDGRRPADIEDTDYQTVTDYQRDTDHIGPKIFAFYYGSESTLDEEVDLTLQGVTGNDNTPVERRGKYQQSNDFDAILQSFQEEVEEQMYDYAFTYQATEGKFYMGEVNYTAIYKDDEVGEAVFSIGTPENVWPLRPESASKYLTALLVTFLTILFFFLVMKVLIPLVKSKSFAMKYYKKYEQDQMVQTRICHFCKQPIEPGQTIVTKCKHMMHVSCWKQNDYRCSEYGQNCKTGIQDYVDWQGLFSWRSIRDCHLTITGILAGLISWVVYELLGRKSFTSLAKAIVDMFFTNENQQAILSNLCVTKVSAFLTEGLLLGFFLSLIFRYNDEYRKKNATVYMKILGLSVVSGAIGMLSFAFGGVIFCMILSGVGTTFIPWYCSLPAYILFSVCTSLSLTIMSSIPVKSAMLGGLCSAVIGFLVLYFTKDNNLSLLLDFIIYGGGLGASLVTVRMLAEKYFLVIQNGSKAGTRIPIHKWMNATGGGNKVTIGMTGDCEIQMNWDKSNRVAKEHAMLFIDHAHSVPVIKPMAPGVNYNSRADLPVHKASVLTNGDTFKIGDTIFQYVETD